MGWMHDTLDYMSKGEIAVVIYSVNRICRHVIERVVHPSHVPLKAEPQATDVVRARDHRPGSRLFGDRLRVGMRLVNLLVEAAEKLDRPKIFAPAELVGNPFAVLARVVEVEHRRDGVDAEPVGVIAPEPE